MTPVLGAAGCRALRPATCLCVGLLLPAGRLPAQAQSARFVPPRQTRSAPVIERGQPFKLTADGTAYGPYLLEDGQSIGRGENRHTVVRIQDGTFYLQATATEALFGPFVFESGAELTIDAHRFQIEVLPPAIFGSIDAAPLVSTRFPVRLLRATPDTFEGLMRLHIAFAGIAEEFARQTAPLRLRAPDVRGPPGLNRSPTIDRSDEDVARARRRAEQSALASLEAFAKRHRTAAAYPGADGGFHFTGLDPAVYYLCALPTLRERDPQTTRMTRPGIWWARVDLHGGTVEVRFGAEHTLAWQDLFVTEEQTAKAVTRERAARSTCRTPAR